MYAGAASKSKKKKNKKKGGGGGANKPDEVADVNGQGEGQEGPDDEPEDETEQTVGISATPLILCYGELTYNLETRASINRPR